MSIALRELSHLERYKLLAASIVPRPIAWVTTWGPNEIVNLAPFSYFTCLSIDPPLIGLAISSRKDGRSKDTVINAQRSGVLAVHIANEAQLEAVQATSVELLSTESEADLVGIRTIRSENLDVPRIVGLPVCFECRVVRVLEPGGDHCLLVAEVEYADVRRDLVDDKGYIDHDRMRPLGRLIGNRYWVGGGVRFADESVVESSVIDGSNHT